MWRSARGGMQIRRLARLTNGFSKKWENLGAACCLRVTPAMQTGITDHVWDLAELLA
jgi:hypothetical protein